MEIRMNEDEHIGAIVVDILEHDPLAWQRADRRVLRRGGVAAVVDTDLAEIARADGVDVVRGMLADVNGLIGSLDRANAADRWVATRFAVARDDLLDFLATVDDVTEKSIGDRLAALDFDVTDDG
jgi:hypothetical protein